MSAPCRTIDSHDPPPQSRTAGSATCVRPALRLAIARSNNGRRPGELEAIEGALSRFTVVQYGQYGQRTDEAGLSDMDLDESLVGAQLVLRRLRIEQTWLMKRLRRNRGAIQVESRVWSR